MPSIINATTTNGVAISPDNSGSLQLATNNGTTAVTIDTSQNLLVGTNTQVAGAKLTLSGSATLGSTYQQVITDGTRAVRLGANSTSAEIQSTGGVPLYLNYGGNDVVIVPQGSGNVITGASSATTGDRIVNTITYDGNNGYSGSRTATVWGDSTVRASAQADGGNGQLILGTESDHRTIFITNNTERMRIDSGGNLLVGTTSSYGGERLTLNFTGSSQRGMVVRNTTSTTQDSIAFVVNSTFVGWVSASTTGTAYNTISDYRLKESIAPMTGALEKVTQLKPVTYTWKTDGSAGQGFIAHELQAVVPDCVTGEKDAVDEEGKPVYQGVDTSFLVATLTAAIQELKAELDTVKAELNTLKNPPVEGTE